MKDEQIHKLEKRNALGQPVASEKLPESASESSTKSKTIDITHAESNRESPKVSGTEIDNAANGSQKREDSQRRPLETIRPSIRTKDYIEYDFSTMRNLNGGYINPEDRSSGYENGEEEFMGSKKQKTLEDWKREQRERKYVYENAPPPEHISEAPKCIECNINIEMDPILHDIFKLQVCKSCAKEHPEKYSLLTKTECKEDYFLTDPELADPELFHKLEKPNPHSGTFARMQLFVRCEIEKFAFEKWGGEKGLDEEWQRRESGKTQRREKKYEKEMLKMRMKTRAQEYTTKLKERKHGKTHIHNFSAPIEGGKSENGYPVLRRRCIECGLETEEISI